MLNFVKMQAQGNDYIYLDLRNQNCSYDFEKLAIKLSNRNFGIGADGIVLIEKSKIADVKMRIFNADGTEAPMCGSALRSLTFLVLGNQSKTLSIETKSGIKTSNVVIQNNKAYVKANLGKAEFFKNVEKHKKHGFEGFPIWVGNPHFVVFDKNASLEMLEKYGKSLQEKDDLFTESCNAELVRIIDKENIEVYVYERGSGITLACGTGACATVYAGIKLDLLEKKVNVKFLGGTVLVEMKDNEMILSGEVKQVFTGKIEI